MATVLRIDSSALSNGSHSKALADFFQTQWLEKHPTDTFQTLDLSQTPPPHLSEATIGAMFTPAEERSQEQTQQLALSTDYIEQLKKADVILISTPMYNFGIPSTLKAYLDHSLRVGETFVYTDKGPKGLLEGKKAIVVAASGGDYTHPPLDAMNFVTPYLKTALGFIGIEDVTLVEAPGMAGDEASINSSTEQAKQALRDCL